MRKAVRFFIVCFFIAIAIKLFHDFSVCYKWLNETQIDLLYGVSNSLFKLAPVYAFFILTRKLLGIDRVIIHLAFVLYLADFFDELFFNPYEYGVGEWLTGLVFYSIINQHYKKK